MEQNDRQEIIGNDVLSNEQTNEQVNDEKSEKKIQDKGLSLPLTAFFIIGDIAGSGMLALPKAFDNAGFIGPVLLLLGALSSGYNGIRLGQCWMIIKRRYPNLGEHIRNPYATIGEKAFGSKMALIGIIAAMATIIATFTISSDIIVYKVKHKPKLEFSNTKVVNLFLAFGTIMFAFGGTATFPTIQHDMNKPEKFHISATFSYIGILSMYQLVALLGYYTFGNQLVDNILKSLSIGWLRYTSEILITIHLIFAFVINSNPVFQTVEHILKIPTNFNWKRCIIRTVVILFIIFVAETIPKFGALLSLVGGTSTAFLTFVAPSMFYLKLCSSKGDWQEIKVPLHHKVICCQLMIIGTLGGIATTYSAISTISSSKTFFLPCYVNITAADLAVNP
ncbi:DgyrCDS10876 [Dimorphilus gyrociliatus]|uniref:DgyrCDS10876 n=1 Tax=Dimorphilus gyrociliatus TaxID=2664684 RepID=A0A7I8W2P8_9ANNE|nr:DgyrCDS10876 [Dimorphilus gyrociliatus]